MRVFIGPSEIAGYYGNLVQGLRSHGVKIIFADLSRDPRRYAGTEHNHQLARTALWFQEAAVARRQRSPRLARLLLAIHACFRIALLLWAALRCDAFIYSFGGTLTWYPHFELRLLRRLRRKIVFVFHGSDSRPPYFEPWLLTQEPAFTLTDCFREAARRKRTVQLAERYADACINNPFSAQFHERQYVNWAAIGIPFSSPPAAESQPNDDGGSVRILHSPSWSAAKGTTGIRKVIAALKARGLPIDYVELSGRPHAEVIAELRRCDFVIDQLYSDVPMAGFPTEAAAYGRPAVVGGYAGPFLAQVVREEWMPPVAYCDPAAMEATVERLVTDATYRRELGRRAREYVVQQRSPEAVAARYIRVLRGDIPEEWLFQPDLLLYANGLGEASAVRDLVRQFVEAGGPSTLLLDNTPRIRDAVLRFAGFGPPT